MSDMCEGVHALVFLRLAPGSYVYAPFLEIIMISNNFSYAQARAYEGIVPSWPGATNYNMATRNYNNCLKTASQRSFVVHLRQPPKRSMIDVKHAWPSSLRLRTPSEAK
eukprot:6200051-Pleurochrysis_carterae.AAC.2